MIRMFAETLRRSSPLTSLLCENEHWTGWTSVNPHQQYRVADVDVDDIPMNEEEVIDEIHDCLVQWAQAFDDEPHDVDLFDSFDEFFESFSDNDKRMLSSIFVEAAGVSENDSAETADNKLYAFLAFLAKPLEKDESTSVGDNKSGLHPRETERGTKAFLDSLRVLKSREPFGNDWARGVKVFDRQAHNFGHPPSDFNAGRSRGGLANPTLNVDAGKASFGESYQLPNTPITEGLLTPLSKQQITAVEKANERFRTMSGNLAESGQEQHTPAAEFRKTAALINAREVKFDEHRLLSSELEAVRAKSGVVRRVESNNFADFAGSRTEKQNYLDQLNAQSQQPVGSEK